jgi:hypothetical protein
MHVYHFSFSQMHVLPGAEPLEALGGGYPPKPQVFSQKQKIKILTLILFCFFFFCFQFSPQIVKAGFEMSFFKLGYYRHILLK